MRQARQHLACGHRAQRQGAGHGAAQLTFDDEEANDDREEEVGLHRRHIDVLGQLDQYRVRTGFSVIPVVGLVTPPFNIKPDDFEVAEVFEVPLTFLMNPANHERHSRNFQGETRHFYAMPYKEYYIWGATAGMLINLYQILTNP